MNDKKIRNTLIFIGCSLLGASSLSVFTYFIFVGGELSNESADWGHFGSFVGGISGAAIAASALLALIYGLIIQHREFSALRAQFSDQRFRDSLQGMKSQYRRSFEFAHLEVTRTTRGARETFQYTGPKALEEIVSLALRQAERQSGSDEDWPTFIVRFSATSSMMREQVRHLYGQYIFIIKYILENFSDQEALEQINILKSQTSTSEVLLIFFLGAMSENDSDRDLISEHQILEIITPRLFDRIPLTLVQRFSAQAYGGQYPRLP